MSSNPLDAIEQEKATRDLARIIRVYFEELVEQGFDPLQAVRLTLAYQTSILRGTVNGDDT